LISKVTEHVFLGDAQDAKTWGGRILCVLEDRPPDEPQHAMVVPILKFVQSKAANQMQLQTIDDGQIHADIEMLDIVAALVNLSVTRNEDILVHCGAGMERSPLAVVWYLHRYERMTIEDAYKLVRASRSETADRRIWLPSWVLYQDALGDMPDANA
jgi:hypothetical protein